MKRLGVSSRECLILEDNENGIKAAIASKGHLMRISDVQDVNLEDILSKINEIEKSGVSA